MTIEKGSQGIRALVQLRIVEQTRRKSTNHVSEKIHLGRLTIKQTEGQTSSSKATP